MSSISVAGDTSGSVTLSAPAVSGSSVLTLPVATDTLVGKATTDTLTNKTLTSPILTTPALGTVASGDISACTGTANSLNAGIGVNQTWTDVSASRAIGTTYTNSTGKPIMVAISYTNSTGNSVQGLTVSGVTVYCAGVTTAGGAGGFALIIPNSATYVSLTNSGTMTKVTWVELR